jgi:hypothetical protein
MVRAVRAPVSCKLLEREQQRQPTTWLDAGDLVVGPVAALLGRQPWLEMRSLPLAAAAAGNHEFDDGIESLLSAVADLSYPVLCANVDVGLPSTTIVPTEAGAIGVIGLTHPATHRFRPSETTGRRLAGARRCARRRPASPGCDDGRGTAAELTGDWISRTGAARYLPDLLAEALRAASSADLVELVQDARWCEHWRQRSAYRRGAAAHRAPARPTARS